MQRPRPLRQPPAFTLIELMVVIGMLAVLASVLIPLLSEAMRRAREKGCSDNLRRIGVATGIYTDLNNRYFPLTWGTRGTGGSQPWEAAGTSSMDSLIEALDDEPEHLVCPTLWHPAGDLPHAGPQGWAWGYEKWAGTLNPSPLTARGALYSRYQDISVSVANLHDDLWRPGYLSETALAQATRRFIVLGNSFGTQLIWQPANNPARVPNLGGHGGISPSAVTLFSDSNRVNATAAVTTSHSRVTQDPDAPTSPPSVYGINELLGDGHVRWYPLPGNSLYYISDQRRGGAGIFVQDNR